MPSPSESKLTGLSGFDPDNIQPWIMQVVISMTTLALLAVGLRLLSRTLNSQKLWWDDWMVIFSMCWNLTVVGFIFTMYSCGMGVHADMVPPGNIVMMAKWLVVAETLYAFNLGWTKLSLLLMYYRIFRTPYFRRTAWVVGVFTMAWAICITFLFVFICVPVEKLWYPQLPGRCINQVSTWIANAISTIFTDLVILLLPIPQVWRLRMSQSEKIGVTAAFGLGSFVVFASAYRTSVLFTYSNSDPTYTLAPTVGWTAIEMSAGIVSACLPTMLPVLYCLERYIGISNLAVRVHRMPFPTFGSKLDKSNSTQRLSWREEDGHLSVVQYPAGNTRNGAFYKLPEEVDSHGMMRKAGSGGAHRVEYALRIGMVLRYDEFQSATEKSGDECEGEIPLQIICR